MRRWGWEFCVLEKIENKKNTIVQKKLKQGKSTKQIRLDYIRRIHTNFDNPSNGSTSLNEPYVIINFLNTKYKN